MDWNFGGWTPLSEGFHSKSLISALNDGDSVSSVSVPSTSSLSSSSVSLSSSPSSSSSSSSASASSTTVSLHHPAARLVSATSGVSNDDTARLASAPAPLSSAPSPLSPSASQSTRAYRYLEFSNPVPRPYFSPPSSYRGRGVSGYNNNNSNKSPGTVINLPPLPPPNAANTAKLPPLKVEPKPLREAQIAAYKVIEQLEAHAEQVLQNANSGKASIIAPPSRGIPPSPAKALKLPLRPALPVYNAYSTPNRPPPSPIGRTPRGNSYAFATSPQYTPGPEVTKTIGLPVKEITKDYITLPVAVETEDGKVLTPADINEIEKEVLRIIPETLGSYADKLPDSVYDNALPLLPQTAVGPRYKTVELPAIVVPAGPPQSFYSQFNSFVPKMPAFMSAFSPSKGKISDILRPLLRKVRPPPPVSPAQQIKGGPSIESDVPAIPGGAPYAGSHRPENLDVIHLIAHQKTGQPAVYHINQLVRSPSTGLIPGEQGQIPPINNFNFPPPQPYQRPNQIMFPSHPVVPPVSFANSYAEGRPASQQVNNFYSNSYSSSSNIPSNNGHTSTSYQEHGMSYDVVSASGSINSPPPESQTSYTPRPSSTYGPGDSSLNTYDGQGALHQQQQAPPQNYQPSLQESNYGGGNDNYQGPQQQSPQQPSTESRPQNEYIEVVNLPAGGGGQSVEYTPPASYSEGGPASPSHLPASPSYASSLSSGQYQEQNQRPLYSGEGQDRNQGQNLYTPALPPAPLNVQHQQGPASQSGGSTIEYIDGGQGGGLQIPYQPVFNPSGDKQVVTLNNYKQTVSALDPKTLVELIAKQVPSLKEVLSTAVDGSSRPSKDSSYEIIEMPPRYHADASQQQQQPSQPQPQPPAPQPPQQPVENYYVNHGDNGGNSNANSNSNDPQDFAASTDSKDYVEQAAVPDDGIIRTSNSDYSEESAIVESSSPSTPVVAAASQQHAQKEAPQQPTHRRETESPAEKNQHSEKLTAAASSPISASTSSASTEEGDEDDAEGEGESSSSFPTSSSPAVPSSTYEKSSETTVTEKDTPVQRK